MSDNPGFCQAASQPEGGDFVFDRTDDGRTIKLMVVIDEYTR